MNANYTEYLAGYAAKNALSFYVSTIDKEAISLSDDQIAIASKNVLSLPHNCISILFFKYIFQATIIHTQKVLIISNPSADLKMSNYLISRSIGLPHNKSIDEKSLMKIVEIAYANYISAVEDETLDIVVDGKLRERLEKKISQSLDFSIVPIRRLVIVWTKRAAVIFVAILTTFTTTLAVSAELRERFFNWVVERFPVFSQFVPIDAPDFDVAYDTERSEQLINIAPTYVPDGYHIENTEFVPMIFKKIIYSNCSDVDIIFHCEQTNDASIRYEKTIDAIFCPILINGQDGITWELDGKNWCVWQEDGFLISIRGEINLDEIIKMANSITK